MTLSRDQQREIGALVTNVDRERNANRSTLPVTIHASADLLEHVVASGCELHRDHSPKQRRRLASEGRALADGSFPVVTGDDARDAIAAVSLAAEEKRWALDQHLIKRVRALRLEGEPFTAWQ